MLYCGLFLLSLAATTTNTDKIEPLPCYAYIMSGTDKRTSASMLSHVHPPRRAAFSINLGSLEITFWGL